MELEKGHRDLLSVMEMESIDEFLVHAELTNREFESRRGPDAERGDGQSILIVNSTAAPVAVTPVVPEQHQSSSEFEWRSLPLPQRPRWSPSDGVEALEQREVAAFLEWRRRLAATEEAVWAAQEQAGGSSRFARIKITPYEKNLEVWRQLWRVVERSDVLVQVVDARQPLFFYSEDLHDYAKSHFRHSSYPAARHVERVMVLNKSDYLTRSQRLAWGRTLQGQGRRFVWFSAKAEQEALDLRGRALRDGDLESVEVAEEGEEAAGPGAAEEEAAQGEEGDEESLCRLATRDDLMGLLEELAGQVHRARTEAGEAGDAVAAAEAGHQGGERLTIGMVGYPNVGKSSVINVLLGATAMSHGQQRVATGATPGKTKHFQTLQLPLRDKWLRGDGADSPPNLTLCDCPGLVFPQFVSSSAEMLCAGVLPVAQLKDYRPPMQLLASRIPRAVLELTYGFKTRDVGMSGSGETAEDIAAARAANQVALMTDQDGVLDFATVESILVGLGRARSWFAAGNRGEVDRSRTARLLLSDLQKGKLVYAQPPPTMRFGSTEFAAYVAATHHTRVQELLVRKKHQPVTGAAAASVDDIGLEELSGLGPSSGEAGAAGGGGFEEAQADGEYELDPFFEGEGEDGEAWMDSELVHEVHGKAAGPGGATADDGATRARTRKNKAMFRKMTKGKGRKNKHVHALDPAASSQVHIAGRRHLGAASGGAGGARPGPPSAEFTRPVLPHHPTYRGETM